LKERVIAAPASSLVFHSIDFAKFYANICFHRDRPPVAPGGKFADLFHQLGLLPKPVKISDAVRSGS
jgi:hypothetical protein